MGKYLVGFTALLALAAAPAGAATKLEVSHFPGATWVAWIAQDQGLFAKEGLEIHLDPIRGSVEQISGMMDGSFDLGLTALDNVIAYDIGQGAEQVKQPTDLFAFMGGEGLSMKLITASDVKTAEGLKGKALAVDAKNTGFAFVLYSALAQHGLKKGDYDVLPVGSSGARLDAVLNGKAQAAGLNRPFDQMALAKGANDLGEMKKVFPHYQAGVGMARRPWAAQHEPQLIGFIRAYVKASEWLFEPANKDAAIGVLIKNTPNLAPEQAATLYHDATGPESVVSPKAALDPAGVASVVELRSQFGEGKKTLNAEDFYDLSYYRAALK